MRMCMCMYMSYMLVGGGERVEHANACGPPRSTCAPHVPETHVCAFGIMCEHDVYLLRSLQLATYLCCELAPS